MNHNKAGFHIELPADWEDQTIYYFRGPEIDGQEHLLMLTIDRNPQAPEITEFASRSKRAILAGLQGVEVLKDEETTLPGCCPTYEFMYRWMPTEGMSVLKRHIFVFHARQGYSFEIGFSKKSYKLLGGQMKKIIESLLPGSYEPLSG